jgi:nucleoid-associated protein
MLLVLNDIDGTTIDPGTLTIRMAPHLDVSHLRLAARVNLNGFGQGDSGYLSFVLGRGNRGEVSSYFRSFLGCADQKTSKHHTAALRHALLDYAEARGMTPELAQQARSRTYEYLSARLKAEEDVFLEDLARYLFPEAPDDFVEYANGDAYQVQSVFRPDAGETRRLQRIEWRGPRLRVDFDRSLLHTGQVKWDKVQKRLILTDVPPVVVDEITEELRTGR